MDRKTDLSWGGGPGFVFGFPPQRTLQASPLMGLYSVWRGVFSLGPHLLHSCPATLILISSQLSCYSHNLSNLPAYYPLKAHTSHLIRILNQDLWQSCISHFCSCQDLDHISLAKTSRAASLEGYSRHISPTLIPPQNISLLRFLPPWLYFSSSEFHAISSKLQWGHILPGRTPVSSILSSPLESCGLLSYLK